MSSASTPAGFAGHPQGVPYSSLEEGKQLGTCRFRVEREQVERLVRLLADDDYKSLEPEGAQAPAAWGFLCVTKAMQEIAVVPPGCIFAGIELDFHRGFEIGSEVVVEVSIDRLYEKRGRPYAEIRYAARAAEGKPLMDLNHIVIWAR